MGKMALDLLPFLPDFIMAGQSSTINFSIAQMATILIVNQ